ncbi:fec operon regulator FecR [compost metagenome]
MNPSQTEINDGLLVKYLLREANSKETELVNLWLAQDKNNEKKLLAFSRILDISKIENLINLDEHLALERLNKRLEYRRSTRRIHVFLTKVAIILIFLIPAYIVYNKKISNETTIKTGQEVLSTVLPDGSTVILNKRSNVTYESNIFKPNRRVSLHGEAFFKVRQDRKKPFEITVNNIKITVIGTSFNVKGREKGTLVNVENGIVRISNSKDSIQLKAGEEIEIGINRTTLKKNKNPRRLYNYYYSNKLVCQDTPLPQLISVLNEKYGCNIIIENPTISSMSITTTFKKESLEEILSVIAETFKIKIIYSPRVIKLR